MQPRKFDFSSLNSAPKKFDFSHLNTQSDMEKENKLNPNIVARIPGALSNIGGDVFNGLISLPGNVVTGAMSLPSNAINVAKGIPDVFNQVKKEPGRAARNAVAGAADIGHSLLNTPRSIGEYLAKIGMIEPETASNIPVQGDISSQLSQFVGEGQHPGDVGIRGTVSNIPNIAAAFTAAKLLNPTKLTYKNLAEKVVEKEKAMKEKYSGENGLYNQLSNKANQRGITGEKISPPEKDLAVLKEHMPGDEFDAIEKLLGDKNITNAQGAISQLSHRERKLIGKSNRGDILSDPEKSLLKAVRDTKQHIQENMFKDKSGKVHADLMNEHREIQKGYANEVIPYTKNSAIQAFKRNEKLPEELISSLSKGKFAAKRGGSHLDIKTRNLLNSVGGSKIGQGAMLGAGASGAYGIIKALMGGND